MDVKYLYKLDGFPKGEELIFETKNKIDTKRFKRTIKLYKLFFLICNFSERYDVKISEILSLIFHRKINFKNVDLLIIKWRIFLTRFKLYEFRYFIDYLLEIKRNELNAKYNLNLPRRYEVCYFF